MKRTHRAEQQTMMLTNRMILRKPIVAHTLCIVAKSKEMLVIEKQNSTMAPEFLNGPAYGLRNDFTKLVIVAMMFPCVGAENERVFRKLFFSFDLLHEK